MTPSDRLRSAYIIARDALLAERVPAGHWVGELSTSALSTATAVMALHLVDSNAYRELIAGGIRWLCKNQNADGGWGDTTKSFSNISTTMLCRAALEISRDAESAERRAATAKVEAYLIKHAGHTPAERAEAIRRRYGKDRTFSVPILMACALAKLVPWNEVPRLPFELACLPQSWYRFARLPVVSYALPALIAIGQCVHANRTSWNPIRNLARRLARGLSLKVLRRIQPTTGGYLEATPLTSFVVMALIGASPTRQQGPAAQVISEGVRFLVNSVRADGSWPIDTNLATWVTTLSVNALAAAGDLESLDKKDAILKWLLDQQYTERHPYTGAAPGGWAWTDLAGGVPDCDDTPGAVIAVQHLGGPLEAISAGRNWMWKLQNGNYGFPTFCKGWGTLPFDRSGSDLTAHALRAFAKGIYATYAAKGRIRDYMFGIDTSEFDMSMETFDYLRRQQRSDGSWLPLWFGNQHAPDDSNPVYGTSRVLAAYRDLGLKDAPECQRGVKYLLSVQNEDGGRGGAAGCPSSVEETALAVEVLIDLMASHETASGSRDACVFAEPVQRGLLWLTEAVESGRFREPSPIGFYFAKLWYFEKLYPLIFTVAARSAAPFVTPVPYDEYMKPAENPPPDEPTLTFWGAAGGVSGSMHLIEVGNHKVLLDCGLHQGKRETARERNAHFPFHPDQIDACILSHAHIDHCGNLPTLVRQGFSGPIFCTPPTRDLLHVMLADSAKIQEEDAAHLNIARNYEEPWVQPLYTHPDVEKTLRQVVQVPYGKDMDATKSVRFRFVEAGHILGSAMVLIRAAGKDRDRTLAFSGDMGRRHMPILKPTATIPAADMLVCESTYGNRIHRSFTETVEKLYEVIRATLSREGKVLIPAFSLGRTQLIIHILQMGLREGKFPKVPIYVDSPLASEVAEVYRKHPDSLSDEIAVALKEGHGILGGDGVRYVETFEESTSLAGRAESSIIISSSGMCDAGRIQQHLKTLIDDPRCSIVLVSYQAFGTTGRRLLEPKPTVRFQGRDWNKWIEVHHLDGFSGHADKDDFLAYLGPIAGKVGKIRLIHGEREQAEALAETLRELGFKDVGVPAPGDRDTIG